MLSSAEFRLFTSRLKGYFGADRKCVQTAVRRVVCGRLIGCARYLRLACGPRVGCSKPLVISAMDAEHLRLAGTDLPSANAGSARTRLPRQSGPRCLCPSVGDQRCAIGLASGLPAALSQEVPNSASLVKATNSQILVKARHITLGSSRDSRGTGPMARPHEFATYFSQ